MCDIAYTRRVHWLYRTWRWVWVCFEVSGSVGYYVGQNKTLIKKNVWLLETADAKHSNAMQVLYSCKSFFLFSFAVLLKYTLQLTLQMLTLFSINLRKSWYSKEVSLLLPYLEAKWLWQNTAFQCPMYMHFSANPISPATSSIRSPITYAHF